MTGGIAKYIKINQFISFGFLCLHLTETATRGPTGEGVQLMVARRAKGSGHRSGNVVGCRQTLATLASWSAWSANTDRLPAMQRIPRQARVGLRNSLVPRRSAGIAGRRAVFAFRYPLPRLAV
jgi:hypothetical protein